MHCSITAMMRYNTASSPDASLASNLQLDTVLLSSARTGSRSEASGEMNPDTKKVWIAANAAEVIGPVDSGERIKAKKGDNRDVSEIESSSGEYKGWCSYK